MTRARTTLNLGLLLLCAVVLAFLWFGDSPKPVGRVEAAIVPELRTHKIESLRIARWQKLKARITTDSPDWDRSRVQGLQDSLALLASRRRVSESPGDVGLLPPRLVVTFTLDNQTEIELAFGREIEAVRGVWLTRKGVPGFFLVDAHVAREFDVDPKEFRARPAEPEPEPEPELAPPAAFGEEPELVNMAEPQHTLSNRDPADLKRVEARAGDRVLEVVERGQFLDRWTSPQGQVDPARIEALTAAARIVATEAVGEPAAHGILRASRAVTLTFDPVPGQSTDEILTLRLGKSQKTGCAATSSLEGLEGRVLYLPADICQALRGPWTK